MKRVHGFAPIADVDAAVLILGSMPGVASLRAGQYYAHPRNAFWPIVASLLAFDTAMPYESKTRALTAARIALWDVLGSCTRAGSLDSNITREVPNDFPAFLRAHRRIARVYFNGAKAENTFRRHVLPALDGHMLRFTRLPSTSPAHAAMSFERKCAAWRVICP